MTWNVSTSRRPAGSFSGLSGWPRTLIRLPHKRLTGPLAGLCKLREGDYRIIYQVLHNEETIVVHAIGHRRDIYRKK